MKIRPIKRIALESPEVAEHVQRCEPFITRLRWPAHDRWTLDYLKGRCTSGHVELLRKTNGSQSEPVTVALREFFDILADPQVTDRYDIDVPPTRIWFDGQPGPHLGTLLEDIAIPSFVAVDRLSSINLWLQTCAFDNGNHYDPNGMHNFNVAVRGRKRWRLFDPNHAAPLKLTPGLERLVPNLVSSDTEHPDSCRDNPGYDDLVCYDATLEAGECIFVPAFFMHWVVHEGELQLNVNFWWEPDVVPLAGIPAGWAFLNAVLRVMRRRMPAANLDEIREALLNLSPETRELLVEIERTLLWEPELLSSGRAFALRRDWAVLARNAPGGNGG